MEGINLKTKTDDPPLLYSGTQTIGFWQLDEYFYKPFVAWNEEASRRKTLVTKLSTYIAELRKFELPIEIWLDGSFTTTKLDPDDVDLAVFVHLEDVARLTPTRQMYFGRLTTDREIIKARYEVDVYLASLDSPKDIKTYSDTFSKGHYNDSAKGFFKIYLNYV